MPQKTLKTLKRKKKNDGRNEDDTPRKKPKTEEFTEITFKYQLRDPATTFSALDKFTEAAEQWSPDSSQYDIVAAYCRSSTECSEIFQVLDAGKRKSGELAAIFGSLETILMRIADDLEKYAMVGQNVVRKVLSSHIGTVYFLLHMSNKSSHIKSAIKLLTAMVMLGDRSARMILAQFDFHNKAIQPLLNRRDKKDPQDVRTCLLHFVMSFLLVGSDDVIKQLLEQKGFLGSVFAGLKSDNAENIQLVLSTLLQKIVQNPAVTKTQKVQLFTEQAMKLLGQLYHWTGPSSWQETSTDEITEVVQQTEDQKLVVDVTHNLLVELCSSHKYGINFYDKTLGTTGRNQNHILTGFLNALTKVTETPLIQELVIKTLRACPDQLCHFLPSMLNTLSPRPSPKWLAAIGFLCKIFEKQSDQPVVLKIKDRVNAHRFVDMLLVDTVPPQQVLQTVLQALKHKHVVVRDTVLDLVNILLKRVMCAIGCLTKENLGRWYTDAEIEDIKQDYGERVIKAIPEVKSLLICWDKVTNKSEDTSQETDNEDTCMADVPVVKTQGHMIKLQQVLCHYQDLMPSVLVDDPVIIYKLLDGVKKMAEQPNQTGSSNSQPEILDDHVQSENSSFDRMLPQLYLLKLLARTDARKLPWGKDSQDGQSLMYLLLEMMMDISISKQTNLTNTTRDLICQLLYSTGLFDHHQGELHLWIKHFVVAMTTLDTTDDKISVVKLLTHVFTAFLKNPYPYVDKVSEFVSEAVTMETTGGLGNLDNVSIGTTDSVIDEILEMDDDMMSETEGDSAVSSDINYDAFRFPFSPVVVIAFECMNKTEDVTPGVKSYLSGMVLDLFHSQLQPLPLVCMINSCHGNRLDSDVLKYILSWLPQGKMKKLKLPGKQIPVLSSRPLMEAFVEMCTKLEETDSKAFAQSLNKLDTEDMILVTRQLLLYVVTTEKTCSKQGTKSSDILNVLLGSINSVLQQCMKRTASGGNDTSELVDDTIKAIINDLENSSRSDPVHEILQTVFTHPVLLKWFLYIKPDGPEDAAMISGTVDRLRHLITAFLSQIFVSSASYDLKKFKIIGEYVEKIKKFMGSIADKKEESSSQQDVVTLIQSNLASFSKHFNREDQLFLLNTLLHLPKSQLIRGRSKLSPLGIFLVSLLKGVMESSCHGSLIELDLQEFDILIKMMSESCISDLNSVCHQLLQKQPHFSVNITKTILHCLVTSSSQCHLDMAAIAVKHSSHARRFLEEWVTEADIDDKSPQIVSVLNTYLLCLLSNKGRSTSAADKISRVYDGKFSALLDIQDVGDLTAVCDLFHLLCHLNVVGEEKQKEVCKKIVSAVKTKQPVKKAHIEVLFRLSLTPGGSVSGPVINSSKLYNMCRKCLMYTLQKKERRDSDFEDYLLQVISNTPQEVIQQMNPSEFQKDFSSLVRACLRSLYTDGRTFRVLDMIVRSVYKTETEMDMTPAMIFDMTLSHSMFVPIMLNESGQELKGCLVDFLCTLVEHSPTSCTSEHIGVYLGAYGATMSKTDQKLLKLLHLYETNKISMKDYRPYLWGPKAMENHTIRRSLGSSLWKQPSTDQVLEYIDRDRLQKSILRFPLQRKLQPNIVQDLSTFHVDDDLYDPCFILPMFSSLLSPESFVDCRKFAETGCVGYAIAGLSCHDSGIRGLAYHVLASYLHHLEASRFPEQQQVLYVVELLRDSVTRTNTKLACIITVFLSRMVSLMFTQDEHMYKVMNSFLLLKPALDITSVPEFYKLFNSSDLEFKLERSWILRLFEDGLRDTLDYKIFEKRYVFKLLLSFHDSAISDKSTQLQVLKIVKSACLQRTVAFDLVKHHGILSWLTGIIIRNTSESHLDILSDILHGLWFTLVCHRTIRGDNPPTEGEAQSTKCLPLAITREMLTSLMALLKCCGAETNPSQYVKCLEALVSTLKHLKDSVVFLKEKDHIVTVTPLTTLDVCCILIHSSNITQDKEIEESCSEAFTMLKGRPLWKKGKTNLDGKHKLMRTEGSTSESTSQEMTVMGKVDESEEMETRNKVSRLGVELLLHWQPSPVVIHDLIISDDSVKGTCCVVYAALSFIVSKLHLISRHTLTSVIDWMCMCFSEGSKLTPVLLNSQRSNFVKCLLQICNMICSSIKTLSDYDSNAQEFKGPRMDELLEKFKKVMCDIARYELQHEQSSDVWKKFFSTFDSADQFPEHLCVELRRYFLGSPSPVGFSNSHSPQASSTSSPKKRQKKKT